MCFSWSEYLVQAFEEYIDHARIEIRATAVAKQLQDQTSCSRSYRERRALAVVDAEPAPLLDQIAYGGQRG